MAQILNLSDKEFKIARTTAKNTSMLKKTPWKEIYYI